MKKYLIIGSLVLLASGAVWADTKISQMPSGGSLTSGDVIPILRGGSNFQATYSPSASGVVSFTGDGVVYNNTASTGAVTLSTNNQNANLVFAGPTTGSGVAPTFRFLVGGDLPVPGLSTLGGIQATAGSSHNWISSITTGGVPQLTQPAFTDISGNISVNQMNSGTNASSSTYWRGDGSWVAVSGSGTVNSGTANQLAYYATSTNAVSGSSLAGLTTGGITLNGLNAISLPDNGSDTTSIGVGPSSLASYATTTGGNTAIGASSLALMTTGLNNTAVGFQALSLDINDQSATAVGYSALQHQAIGGSTTGGNTAVGFEAAQTSVTGVGLTSIGYASLQAATAGPNTALGWKAGNKVTSGTGNVLLGDSAGVNLTAATNNIVIGSQVAGLTNQTGNIAIGNGAMNAAGSSTANSVAVGTSAMLSGSGTVTNDVAIGFAALLLTSTQSNTGVGSGAGRNISSGGGNTAVGFDAILSVSGTPVTGTLNTAVGSSSELALIAGGASNTAVGANSLLATTTGIDNTVLGTNAGASITTGGNNLALGYQVGSSTLTTGSSNILVGTSSAVTTPAAGTSGWINIGGGILVDNNAPTVSSGFGSSPSITHGTSNAAFTVNVGTGGSATSGVIAFTNAAPNGWACNVTDSTSVTSIVTASVPTSTTSVTWTSYGRTTGTSTAWNASDILVANCHGY